MYNAPVLSNDSVGDFCARHAVPREALFAMNPHLYDQGSFRLDSGELTAQLVEGQPLRVYQSEPLKLSMEGGAAGVVFTEQQLLWHRTCWEGGGVSIPGEEKDGCAKVIQKDGKTILMFDKGATDATPEQLAMIDKARVCWAKEGIPIFHDDVGDMGVVCHRLVKREDKYIVSTETISDLEPEKKEEGWGLGTKVGVSVGALLLGAIAIKVLL